jgi:hypothetical protein
VGSANSNIRKKAWCYKMTAPFNGGYLVTQRVHKHVQYYLFDARVIRFQIGIRSVKSIRNDIFESAALLLPGSSESGRIAVSRTVLSLLFSNKVFCVCNSQYAVPYT